MDSEQEYAFRTRQARRQGWAILVVIAVGIAIGLVLRSWL